MKGTKSALGPRSPRTGIKVRPEIRCNFRSVLLDFQPFTQNPVFVCPFAHPILLLSHSIYLQYLWRLRYMQISYEMVCNEHVRHLTVSL